MFFLISIFYDFSEKFPVYTQFKQKKVTFAYKMICFNQFLEFFCKKFFIEMKTFATNLFKHAR